MYICWRQKRNDFFFSPLAADLASFMFHVSVVYTPLLKLQHVFGLFNFLSYGLTFVTAEKGIKGEKMYPGIFSSTTISDVVVS